MARKNKNSSIGIPPYRARCRIRFEPVWLNEEIIDGVNAINSKPKVPNELFRHIDNLGYERYAKHSLYTHSNSKKPQVDKIIAMMNSIDEISVSVNYANKTIARSKNGIIVY